MAHRDISPQSEVLLETAPEVPERRARQTSCAPGAAVPRRASALALPRGRRCAVPRQLRQADGLRLRTPGTAAPEHIWLHTCAAGRDGTRRVCRPQEENSSPLHSHDHKLQYRRVYLLPCTPPAPVPSSLTRQLSSCYSNVC